jgi:hypothetical protein
VLEGEILVHVEGTEHRVGPGWCRSGPARCSTCVLGDLGDGANSRAADPGSGEAFYRDASEPATDETDAERPPDLDRLRAAAERNPSCIEILGPPPFEAAKNSPREPKPRARRWLTVYQAGGEVLTPEPGGTLWRDRNSSMTSCGSW